mmetsp:Transcript_15453/g.20395  ORF Transcript_15453/g.20395 Transcript_15453/m.20395 type:complete len:606 (-) Transcript_15453:141-1958(-)
MLFNLSLIFIDRMKTFFIINIAIIIFFAHGFRSIFFSIKNRVEDGTAQSLWASTMAHQNMAVKSKMFMNDDTIFTDNIKVYKRPQITLPDDSIQLFLPHSLSNMNDHTIGICYFDQKYNRCASVGVLGKISKIIRRGSNRQGCLCEVSTFGRFEVISTDDGSTKQEENVFSAKILPLAEDSSDTDNENTEINIKIKADITDSYYSINELQHKLFSLQGIFPSEWKRFEKNTYLEDLSPYKCSFELMKYMSIPETKKQAILSTRTTADRLQHLASYLKNQECSLQSSLGTFEDIQVPPTSIPAQVYQKCAPAIVSVMKVGPRQAVSGKATGFLVSNDGLIVTNEHVVVPSMNISVTFSGGITLPAKVVRFDDQKDLALLRVNLTEELADIKPLQLATLGSVYVGQPAVAIGNQGGFEKIVTAGIVCGLKYSEGNLDRRPLYIISDAIINGGSSGGPLLNEKGEVLGINTFTTSQTQGLGFAVWIDYVRSILQEEQDVIKSQSSSTLQLKCEIWLYNDGFNKKSHVQQTLMDVFKWEAKRAEDVMLHANNFGKSFCGVFFHEEATKVFEMLQAADLQVTMKEIVPSPLFECNNSLISSKETNSLFLD